MKKNIFKIALLTIITLILLIISAPSFDLKIAGKQVKLNEISLNGIGIDATLPNLKPGKEIYPSTKYRFQITFAETDSAEFKKETLNKTLNTIRKRIDYSNLYNIEVEAEIKDSNYFITLVIPNTYTNSRQYADWISNNGNVEVIKFVQDPNYTDPEAQPQIQTIALKDYQIKQIEKNRNIFINIDTTQKRTVSIPHLTLSFESNVQNLFQGINVLTADDFQSGLAAVQLYIGNQGYGLYAHESNPNVVRAIPTGNASLNNSIDIDNFLSLTQSYFMEPTTLQNDLTIQEATEFVDAQYNNDGAIFITLTFIVALGLISLYALRYFGLRKGGVLFVTLGASLLISFVLLKFMQASISTGFIVGFIIALLILSYVIFDMFKNGVKAIEITDYTFFAIVPVIITVAFSMLQLNLDLVNDVLPIISTSFVGFIIAIQVYLRLLIQIFKIDK